VTERSSRASLGRYLASALMICTFSAYGKPYTVIGGMQVVDITREDLAARRAYFAWGRSDIPPIMGIVGHPEAAQSMLPPEE